nr:hypothetical protein [Tanacetum cinerariifolium]
MDIGTPLMLDLYTSDMCIQSWGRSSYARDLIKIRADVELKDTIVVAMPKLNEEGFYTCTVRVEYEWKPPRCACCKVFGHIQEECPNNLGVGVAKNLKKPSQTSKGVPVGSKKGAEPVKEVSNSNPFDMLNSVVNDEELGTNGGDLNFPSKGATSSGSSFWNVKTSSISATPIMEKITKLEQQIIDGIGTLVDDDGKPLKRVEYLGDHDSDDEVYSVDNDMAHDMVTKMVGFGTQSLLEKKKNSYENGDYDEDPYNDDIYEGQDIPDKLQDICDSLDIRVRGRRMNLFFE